MIRVFPYSGIQFMVFDRCKTYMLHQHQQQRLMGDDRAWGLSAMESLAAGCFAGSVSVVSTYPLDLTRSQLAVLKKKRHHHNKGFRQILYQNYEHRVSLSVVCRCCSCARFLYCHILLMLMDLRALSPRVSWACFVVARRHYLVFFHTLVLHMP